MDNYPCKNCIVKGICHKLCPRLIGVIDTIGNDYNTYNNMTIAKALIKHRRCLDCGCKGAVKAWDRGITCIDCRSTYYVIFLRDPPAVKRYYKSRISTDDCDPEITFGEYVDKYLGV
jgi:hypothetical protein